MSIVSYIDSLAESCSGFDFSECKRNELLLQSAGKKSSSGGSFDAALAGAGQLAQSINARTMMTGTTICGVTCSDGVVIAADTRATMGHLVADKNCKKLHKIATNIWTAGAGVAADLEHVCEQMASNMELLRLQNDRLPRVQTLVSRVSQHLWKYQGHIVTALVVAGVDCTGPSLWTISPDGNAMRQPFTSMGSGGLFALSILEAGYVDGMDMKAGIELTTKAITSGIMNDMGSGGFVDVMCIPLDSPNEPRYFRNHQCPTMPDFPPANTFVFPRGTTTVLEETSTTVTRR